MHPTLAPGDLVVVDLRRREQVEPEALVVATIPGEETIVIKRVLSRGDHSCYLGSDNPLEGRDSRQFGSVPMDALFGEVVQHLHIAALQERWKSLRVSER